MSKKISKTGRWDPEQEESLKQCFKDVGIEPEILNIKLQKWDRYCLYWYALQKNFNHLFYLEISYYRSNNINIYAQANLLSNLRIETIQ